MSAEEKLKSPVEPNNNENGLSKKTKLCSEWPMIEIGILPTPIFLQAAVLQGSLHNILQYYIPIYLPTYFDIINYVGRNTFWYFSFGHKKFSEMKTQAEKGNVFRNRIKF